MQLSATAKIPYDIFDNAWNAIDICQSLDLQMY